MMQEYLQQIMGDHVLRIIISNPKKKDAAFKKYEIDYFDGAYRVTKYSQTQVFHEIIHDHQIVDQLLLIMADFKQCNAFNNEYEHSIKTTKKEKVFYQKSKLKNKITLKNTHNRVKNYLLKEGTIIPPLIDIGVMNKDGNINKAKYDKFKQINRFVEMIDDVLKTRNDEELNIIDFGCGKSYLTFILYYYLVEIKKMKVSMIGLDLKKDVIEKCNQTAQTYGYQNLVFKLGDIQNYQCQGKVDMVISLHACDTATDFALFNAISWNASMIFSVPCCQHEVNQQIKTKELSIITRYGLIKERTSALFTDAIRANLLSYMGYKTQVLEFIDMEHTPKNILIRAIKKPSRKEQKYLDEVEELISRFDLHPTLYQLLKQNNLF